MYQIDRYLIKSASDNNIELRKRFNNNNIVNDKGTSILCGACFSQNPKILCGRCKSIKYCDNDCQRADRSHQKYCFETYLFSSKEEIVSTVENEMLENVFTNTLMRFKYTTDPLTAPTRNFRVINNPERKTFLINDKVINSARILAYDHTISEELVEYIAAKLNISIKFGRTINNVSPVDLFSQSVNTKENKLRYSV